MKNVLAFLIVLEVCDDHLQYVTNQLQEKNVLNEMRETSNFFAKLLLAPSQMKSVLAFLTVLEVCDGNLQCFTKQLQEKNIFNEMGQISSFFAKLLPTPSQMKRFANFQNCQKRSSFGRVPAAVLQKNLIFDLFRSRLFSCNCFVKH